MIKYDVLILYLLYQLIIIIAKINVRKKVQKWALTFISCYSNESHAYLLATPTTC